LIIRECRSASGDGGSSVIDMDLVRMGYRPAYARILEIARSR
jgi:hypothetical protein